MIGTYVVKEISVVREELSARIYDCFNKYSDDK